MKNSDLNFALSQELASGWHQVFLADLVRLPSSRGLEVAVQERVVSEFRALGLECQAIAQTFSQPHRRPSSPACNWTGLLRGRGEGKSLSLNFHLDAAPEGPVELWSQPPFGAIVEDGRLYGRGAWDDKAGAVLALLVLRTLRRAGVELAGDLSLMSVLEDETTGAGTESCMRAGHDCDAAIVLDGAYGPHGIVGHPGHVTFTLTVYGKPAPSSRADLGVSAIEKLYPVLQHLRSLEESANARASSPWKELGRPVSFNPGRIQGGSWTGAVAEKCELEAQMAFLPPHTVPSFQAFLREQLEQFCQSDDWLKDHPVQIEFHDLACDPLILQAEGPFYERFSESCQKVFGAPLTTRMVTGWCDLRHFQLGRPRPCLLFGPGRGSGAHRPDEYFELDQFEPHAQVLLDFISDWCN